MAEPRRRCPTCNLRVTLAWRAGRWWGRCERCGKEWRARPTQVYKPRPSPWWRTVAHTIADPKEG